MVQTGSDARHPLGRFRGLLAGLIAAVSAMVLLGERIAALASAPVISHLYVFFDLFKAEILALLLILMLWSPLKRVLLEDLGEYGRSAAALLRGSMEERARLPIVTAILLVAVAATGYNGLRYVQGKRLVISRYPLMLVARADAEFKAGRVARSERILEACVAVTRSRHCQAVLDRVSDRLAQASELRTLSYTLPASVPAPLTLQVDILKLDRDAASYDASVTPLLREHETLEGEYRRACDLIAQRRLDEAITILQGIQERKPGFGWCHKLIDEAEKLKADPQYCGTLLGGLDRYGSEQFAKWLAPAWPLAPANEILASDVEPWLY